MIASLATLIGDPYAIITGWTLLLILWETTVVGVVLAVWRAWRPHGSAREQHTAATVAFGTALLLAIVTPLVLLLSPIPAANPMAAETTFVLAQGDGAVKAQQTMPLAGGRQLAASISADLVAGTAAVIWLIGVAALGVRLAGGWLLARSIRTRAAMTDDETLLETTRSLAGELRLSPDIPVLQSNRVEAPVVIGWRRPVLILPADVTESLSPEMLSAVLTHELAHIQRRDYLANFLQSIVELLLFFSPAVTWMSRCIREAREYCCDDVAVEKCGDPKHYVNALTTLASLGAINAARPAMGAAGPRLITRVRRLLHRDTGPRLTVVRLVGACLALVILAVFGPRVATASASRAAGLWSVGEPRSVSAMRQNPPPYGYASEQEGSGVVLGISPPTQEAPLSRASIRNTTNEIVTGVRVATSVERIGRGSFFGLRPVELFVSEMLPVAIAPGETLEIAPRFFTAQDLQRIAEATPGAHLQLFFGLSAVRYANGFEWRIPLNPLARTGSDVFKRAHSQPPRSLDGRDPDRAQLPRSVIDRDAGRPQKSYGACRDDRDRAYSHGAAVSLIGEPGRTARCENGRWVESTTGR